MYAPILVRLLKSTSLETLERLCQLRYRTRQSSPRRFIRYQPLLVYSSNSQLLHSRRYHGIINSQSKYLINMHQLSMPTVLTMYANQSSDCLNSISDNYIRSFKCKSSMLIRKDHPSLPGRRSCAFRTPSSKTLRLNRCVVVEGADPAAIVRLLYSFSIIFLLLVGNTGCSQSGHYQASCG